MNILETERLTLLEQTEEDASFILELMNSPGWLKYIGDRNVHTIDSARKYIKDGAMKSYAQNGFGLYLARLKDNDAPVGICGLVKRDGLEQVDIGFAFLPGYEGRGYGYESAAAVMDYACSVLGIKVIVAITVKENIASISLLHKIGMSFREVIMMHGGDEELMLFEKQF